MRRDAIAHAHASSGETTPARTERRGSGIEPSIIAVDWEVAGERIAMVSTIATFGSAADITLTELRIETILPADEASDRAMRRLARAMD